MKSLTKTILKWIAAHIAIYSVLGIFLHFAVYEYAQTMTHCLVVTIGIISLTTVINSAIYEWGFLSFSIARFEFRYNDYMEQVDIIEKLGELQKLSNFFSTILVKKKLIIETELMDGFRDIIDNLFQTEGEALKIRKEVLTNK
jgi:hypothetical protein